MSLLFSRICHSEFNVCIVFYIFFVELNSQNFHVSFSAQGPIIVLATAHIGKFTEQVESKLGPRDSTFKLALDQCVPSQLSQLRSLKERKTNVPASDMAVLNQLRSRMRSNSMLTSMVVLVASVAIVSLCAKYFSRPS